MLRKRRRRAPLLRAANDFLEIGAGSNMGATGIGSFENDLAMDFLDELRDLDNDDDVILALKSALSSVIAVRPGEYLDRDLGEPAVAASAIVVAKALGRGRILEEVEVLSSTAVIPPALVSLVEPALGRVSLDDSEVYRLWLDGGRGRDWKAQIDRLSQEAKSLA